jgi:prevent-host-death family protein
MQVNIYEAKTRLSELVEQARQGETIVIAKNGTPLAKLVPLGAPTKPKIVFGLMKGEFIEADDFDAPLPDDLLAAFEGRDPGEPPVP